jgi:hypothetical protein
MTKYTFFYASVGGLFDVTNDAGNGNGNDVNVKRSNDQVSHRPESDLETKSLSNKPRLQTKRSYLHWSISDSSVSTDNCKYKFH